MEKLIAELIIIGIFLALLANAVVDSHKNKGD